MPLLSSVTCGPRRLDRHRHAQLAAILQLAPWQNTRLPGSRLAVEPSAFIVKLVGVLHPAQRCRAPASIPSRLALATSSSRCPSAAASASPALSVSRSSDAASA